MASKAADSHSAEKGQAPTRLVHHHAGRFQGGVVASTETYSLSWTPSTTLSAGTYRWSVVSVDIHDVQSPMPTLGSQRTFAIAGGVPTTAAAPLTPLAPAGAAPTVRAPALRWEPDPQAAFYRVYVGRAGSTAVSYLTDESGRAESFRYPTATDVTANNLKAGTYRWYVEAYDPDGGFLGDGPDGMFEIADLELDSVTGEKVALSGLDLQSHSCGNALSAPPGEPNFCRDLKQTPVLSWNPVPQASHYLVYLYNDRALTNDVFTNVRYIETQNTTWTPRTLLADSQAGDAYYWVVRPCKARGICAPDPTSATHAFDKRSNQVAPIVDAATTQQADDITLEWLDYLATN